MPIKRAHVVRLTLTLGLVAGASTLVLGGSSNAADEPPLRPVPRADCNKASKPETDIQGRVPKSDYTSGRAAKGYTCNTSEVSHFGNSGGFKVYRYVDAAGHDCAFYDSTLLFPTDVVFNVGSEGIGTMVLDMSDPAHPKKTATLVTPAMDSPHESLFLNKKRGLLAAVLGNPGTAPGIVDIYSVKEDCRKPVLQSSSPVGLLGHESGFAPDGRTFYASSTSGMTLTAIDVSNPKAPSTLATKFGVNYHGLRLNKAGTRMYVADIGIPTLGGRVATNGLTILDVSEIQNRQPNPQIKTLSSLTWHSQSIPQAADPIVIKGHKYLLETDEFANFTLGLPLLTGGGYEADAPVGAARLINIDNEKKPYVVSNIRLEVHQLANRSGPQAKDPGANLPIQGYAGHYCSTPRYKNPGIVACSMIASGLRIFDISDPLHPKEVGYFNKPNLPGKKALHDGGFAMSAPAYNLKKRQVWYTDGGSGFYAVRLSKAIVPKHYWK